MFMFITYPWPVASANMHVTEQLESPAAHAPAAEGAIDQRARDLEEMVCWTDRERLTILWCRFRLAIRDKRRRA